MKKTLKAVIQTVVRDRAKSRENGDIAAAMIIISLFAIVALIGINWMSSAIGSKTPQTTSRQPANQDSPAIPAAPVDISSILGVLAVLAIVVVAIGAIIALIWFFRKMVFAKGVNSANVDAWKTLIAKHREIRANWASYELDAAKILDFPLMTDMREPATLALHKALKHALSLEPKDIRSVKFVGAAAASPFFRAVNDLDVAFHAAEAEARRVVWSRFSSDERKRLATAKNLLNIAMDSAASDFERQMAYKRVFKEIEGLIRIPEQAVLALEKSHMLSLAA